jgi:hypothetical protein
LAFIFLPPARPKNTIFGFANEHHFTNKTADPAGNGAFREKVL